MGLQGGAMAMVVQRPLLGGPPARFGACSTLGAEGHPKGQARGVEVKPLACHPNTLHLLLKIITVRLLFPLLRKNV